VSLFIPGIKGPEGKNNLCSGEEIAFAREMLSILRDYVFLINLNIFASIPL
jgi:hypothetical protein